MDYILENLNEIVQCAVIVIIAVFQVVSKKTATLSNLNLKGFIEKRSKESKDSLEKFSSELVGTEINRMTLELNSIKNQIANNVESLKNKNKQLISQIENLTTELKKVKLENDDILNNLKKKDIIVQEELSSIKREQRRRLTNNG